MSITTSFRWFAATSTSRSQGLWLPLRTVIWYVPAGTLDTISVPSGFVVPDLLLVEPQIDASHARADDQRHEPDLLADPGHLNGERAPARRGRARCCP